MADGSVQDKGHASVGIMQPYFFPYVGYWQLYFHVDDWIFFDTSRFSRKSWVTRNRILHPSMKEESQYFTVPVRKNQFGFPISAVKINTDEPWQQKFLGKLTFYKGLGAPFYAEVVSLIDEVLVRQAGSDSLIALIQASFDAVSSYLGLSRPNRLLSETTYQPAETEMQAGGWALSICQHFGYRNYINPAGGWAIFDESCYREAGVSLRFLRPSIKAYPQGTDRPFVPQLSILDILLWNSPEQVRAILTSGFEIVTRAQLEKA
jgi:hypothetical protein